MICSKLNNSFNDTEKIAQLDGYISFFNAVGYLSGELFFYIQVKNFLLIKLYLFLCLVYFIFGLFWFYKFIIFYTGLSLYQKLVSVIIPVIIFECLINLQIYSEVNNNGSEGKIFIILSIICNLVKNTLIRIILYGISIGGLIIV